MPALLDKIISEEGEKLKAAAKHHGRRPKDHPNDDALLQHLTDLQHSNSAVVRANVTGDVYPPSTTPLAELDTILVRHLRLGVHHLGDCIAVITTSEPHRDVATTLVVKDASGQETVCLYHQDRKIEPMVNFPKGWILIIKEPYYQITNNGNYAVRVDHISDIVPLLETNDDRPILQWRATIKEFEKTADFWKNQGNRLCQAKDFSAAVGGYTTALEFAKDDSERFLIRNNRAEAYLKHGSFDAALVDADSVPKSHPLFHKALFRSARASYELQHFDKAEQKLKSLIWINESEKRDNRDATRELARVMERQKEESGVYDFGKMRKETTDGSFYLDHAVYQRTVKMQPSEGRRFGLFVKKAVKAGELLLCEKAFVASMKSDDPNDSQYFHLNFVFGNYIPGRTYPLLVNEIVQKLWKNPSLRFSFMDLYAGEYERIPDTEVDGKPVIDTFLIERITLLNSISVEGAITEETSDRELAKEDNPSSAKRSSGALGLWRLASYINHECIGNTRVAFIGDMIIVRAARDLPSNTEITFPYVDIEKHYEERQARHEKNWQFRCNCALCQAEAGEDAEQVRLRKVLLGKLSEALEALENVNGYMDEGQKEGEITSNSSRSSSSSSSRTEQFNLIHSLLDALADTYTHPPLLQPRIDMSTPLLTLTQTYARLSNAPKMMTTSLALLHALGYQVETSATHFAIVTWGAVVQDVLEALCLLWDASYGVGMQTAYVDGLEEVVKLVYRMIVGEGESFEGRIGGVVRR